MGVACKDKSARIGLGRQMKRLSMRVDQVLKNPRKALQNKRPSNLNNTRGAVQEENALNAEGLKILENLAKEIEQYMTEEMNSNDSFGKEKAPQVSVLKYMGRLARYCNIMTGGQDGGRESAGVRSCVMAFMYLDKLVSEKEFKLNEFNVHRVIQAAVLCALKFQEDLKITSSYWSKVAGCNQEEVNSLERSFCSLIGFELYVKDAAYDRCLDQFDLPEF